MDTKMIMWMARIDGDEVEKMNNYNNNYYSRKNYDLFNKWLKASVCLEWES